MTPTLRHLLLVADRVLIQPLESEARTHAGLYLPASVRAKDKVQGGTVVRTGPGFLMPNPDYSEAETWATERQVVRYLPLQAQVGDYALYLQDQGIDVELDGVRYVIVPHQAILALVRPDHPLDSLDLTPPPDAEGDAP